MFDMSGNLTKIETQLTLNKNVKLFIFWGQSDPFVMDLALFDRRGFLVTICTTNFDDVIRLVQHDVTQLLLCY